MSCFIRLINRLFSVTSAWYYVLQHCHRFAQKNRCPPHCHCPPPLLAVSMAELKLMPPIKRREKHLARHGTREREREWKGGGRVGRVANHTYQHTIRCWLPHKNPLLTNSPAPALSLKSFLSSRALSLTHCSFDCLGAAQIIPKNKYNTHTHARTRQTQSRTHTHTHALINTYAACNTNTNSFEWISALSHTLSHTHTQILLVPFRSAFYVRRCRCWRCRRRCRLCRPVTIVLQFVSPPASASLLLLLPLRAACCQLSFLLPIAEIILR